MSLAPGTKIGVYEVVALIGAGGMGEVYRARDTKLGRDVALKLLPATFTTDAERLARFRREAQVLASLNHPHIGAIYGLDEANGAQFLVLELVDGESLDKRIARGAIPVEEALGIAKQIAEALEAAHEKGIIHRDLKPANIALTRDGHVKVLDFGLAKAMEPASAKSVDLANSPTITSPAMMTGVGVILGTAAYMSPEQAKGRPADKRSDLWAFGCVLYEMLTGKRAFAGEDVSDTLAAVLRGEPDWAALPTDTPALIRRILRRCVAKDRKRRLADAAHARLEIEEALSAPTENASPVSVTMTRAGWPRALSWALVGAMATGVALMLVLWVVWRRPLAPAPVTHLQMSVRPADHLVGSSSSVRPSRTAIALSPEGRRVVFSATRGTVTQLYVRGLDQVDAMPVPGTEGATGPFLSPDGGWIGFWTDNKIKKVPITGGPPATIWDAPRGARGLGASWGEDGTVFFGQLGAGIASVSAAGGPSATVTAPDASKNERHLLPHALPGGKALLFTAVTGDAWETANVVLQSLDTGERRVLIPGGADARYVPTGHLVYMKAGTLMAVPFDLRSRHVTGASVALIEGVMHAVNTRSDEIETGAGQFSVSNGGTLLYVVGGVSPLLDNSLVWADRKGEAQPLAASPPRAYVSPRRSPDGQKVAVFVRNGTNRDGDVWVYDVLRGAPTRLTFGGRNLFPVWSPDGTRLIYSSDTAGVPNLYAVNADGSGTPERLTTSDHLQVPSSWASTGNAIAFLEYDSPRYQIWILPLDGDRKPRLFLESRFNLSYSYPEFSPDGHWIAYVSNESGASEVYVQPYRGPGEKIRISTDGGGEPIWTANGRELLYRARTLDGERFFSAAILSLAPFRADAPRLVFHAKPSEYVSTGPTRGWDVSSDGQRFLLGRIVESTDKPVTEMHVVLNWAEELKRRVPVTR